MYNVYLTPRISANPIATYKHYATVSARGVCANPTCASTVGLNTYKDCCVGGGQNLL